MTIRQDLINTLESQAHTERANRALVTIFENLQQQYDPTMAGWTATGSGAGEKEDILREIDLNELRRQSNKVFLQNPHGRNLIQTPVKFVIGGGCLVDFFEKDEKKLEKLQKWLRKCQKSVKWFSFIHEFVTRAYRDGEVFVRKYDNGDDPLKLRFVEPGNIEKIDYEVKDEAGQILEKDIENPQRYEINKSWVSAEDILHFKSLTADRNMERGRPSLESALKDLTKHDKWADARLMLSLVRTSVALVQEVQGTNTDLLRIRSNQQTTRNRPGQTDRAKMFQPGTIIRGTPGVQYKMLSPNLDARDAAEDGRTFLIAAGAGQGLPDSFTTMDWQRSNFASSVVAQNPAIRKFEQDQRLFAEPISDIVTWFLEDGLEKGELDKGTDLDHDINFPPLLRRDLAQENAAYALMNERHALSLNDWAQAMGFDFDEQLKKIQNEKALGLYPEPKPQGASSSDLKSPPKRVEDRQPRQTKVTGSGESKKITVSVLPKKEKMNGTAQHFDLEYHTVRPEQSPEMEDPQEESSAL